jgi:hypothetical protein
MLATLSTLASLSAAATWRLEGGWDGMRAVAHIDVGGGLVLRSLTGRDVTAVCPSWQSSPDCSAAEELPETGGIIPLLQIVPSKTFQERLVVVTPKVASVLAAVITRLRVKGDSAAPMVARHDAHERR